MSLRRRLLLILFSVLLLFWAIALTQVRWRTTHEVEEVFDATLAQTARTLLSLVEHAFTSEGQVKQDILSEYISHYGHRYEAKIAFVIRFPNLPYTFRSQSAPEFNIEAHDPFTHDDHNPTLMPVDKVEVEGVIVEQQGLQLSVHVLEYEDFRPPQSVISVSIEHAQISIEPEHLKWFSTSHGSELNADALSNLNNNLPQHTMIEIEGDWDGHVLHAQEIEIQGHGEEGYSNQRIDGVLWRVFTLQAPESGIVVQAGERYDIRDELVTSITLSVLKPILLVLPLLAALIWFSIGRGLQPLKRLATDVARRDSKQLQPISIRQVPTEVLPLTNALNDLFQRLAQAFDNERRFTADAAHELRTPLAGIKTQVEVASHASDETERQQALQHIAQGMERASHLVNQLLSLARMDAEHSLSTVPVELTQLAIDIIMELMPIAQTKDIDLGMSGSESGQTYTVQGNYEALFALMRNLVDNALRYTQNGGEVTIALQQQPTGCQLCVIDNGPGIPRELHNKMFERFHRGQQHDTKGSGLGLSIVQRIVTLHQAELSLLGTEGGGLTVCVQFREHL